MKPLLQTLLLICISYISYAQELRTEAEKVNLDSIVAVNGLSKSVYTYDVTGNYTEIFYNRMAVSSVFQPYQKKVTSRSVTGNITTMKNDIFLWVDSSKSWTALMHFENGYDPSDNITTESMYLFINNQFQGNSRYDYTYNQAKQKTSETQFTWNATTNKWDNSTLYEFTYDVNGRPISRINSRWNSETSQWDKSSKTEYTTDVYGNIIKDQFFSSWSKIRQEWGGVPNDFSYYANVLDKNNKAVSIIYYKISQSGDTNLINKKELAYDSYGNQTMRADYMWSNGSWTGSTKYEETFDANKNKTSMAFYSWSSSQWQGAYKQVYSVDASVLASTLNVGYSLVDFKNKVILREEYQWLNGSWTPYVSHNYYYSDKPTGISKERELLQNNLYPNPCRDQLFISSNSDNILGFEIASIDGSVFSTQKGFSSSINTNHLPEGLYLLKLHSAAGTQVFKFLKKE